MKGIEIKLLKKSDSMESLFFFWFDNLSQATAVIVPTRSLANSLNEQIAATKLAQGKIVWEAPNILLWQDYLALLWQANRDQFANQLGVHGLLTAQQSLLLWTQVIDASRRKERALSLLNVQQTARAAQRSWKLMGDWLIEPEIIRNDHVADTDQFLDWVAQYQSLLQQRGLLDIPGFLQKILTNTIEWPHSKLIWYCYDLVTDAQHACNEAAKQSAVQVSFLEIDSASEAEPEMQVYAHHRDELRGVLEQARALIETDKRLRINIVIPDLQHRYSEVKEIARETFYADFSPLEAIRHDTIYRFSLGQPLNEWAAIEAALRALALLNNHTNVADLGFLLRNEFLHSSRNLRQECRLFERWLKRRRYHRLSLESLADLYQQCLAQSNSNQLPEKTELGAFLMSLHEQRQELAGLLEQRKNTNGFAAMSFSEWVTVFTKWLDLWGWRTDRGSSGADSVEFQLKQRWQSLIEEYAALAKVQKQLGLRRALELLQQMSRDAIFLPKALASPIFISGVYEAIGRPADSSFVIGMNQNYPPPPQADSFIPNRLLANTGLPDARPESSFKQAAKVIQSLLSAAGKTTISYSLISDELAETTSQPSPLYRNIVFQPVAKPAQLDDSPARIDYVDEQGPVWGGDNRVPGGAQIFENQSQCEFKAFATHQLGFDEQQESEFGLDALDHGIFVHQLLQALWSSIADQKALSEMSVSNRHSLINSVIETEIRKAQTQVADDKFILLQQEQQRFFNLLENWLQIELKRCQNFFVIETEELRTVEIGGIKFKYIIDRLDMTDDGRTVLIDYKTGEVARKDWLGERLKHPQLPLYSLALNIAKKTPLAGIAYAKVKGEGEYQELSEAGIFRDNRWADNYQQSWLDSSVSWPQIFEQLGRDFLAGNAKVNPIDDETCRYCKLQSLCRIKQFDRKVDEFDSLVSE